MKNLLKPLWSKGMLVFAIILFLLDLFSFLYVQGFRSWWLMFVIELSGIVAYVIAQNITNYEENMWFND